MSKKIAILSAVIASGFAGSAMAATLGGPLDSSLFAHKYEGDVLPTAAGLGFALVDPAGLASTVDNPASLGVSGGVTYLRLDTDTNTPNSEVFSYRLTGGPGTNWNPHFLGGFTIELRAIIRPTNSGTYGAGIGASDENSTGLTQFFHDHITGDNGTSVSTASNAGGWHTFRIASYSTDDSSAGQVYEIFRDGVSIAVIGQNTNFPTPTLEFGDFISGVPAMNWDIDYLRWDTTGAYAPAPIPEPTIMGLAMVGAAGLLVRRRNRA